MNIVKLLFLAKDIREEIKARKNGKAETSELVESTEALPLNVQAYATQVLFGLIRHAMTAAGVGAFLTDDWVMQAVSLLVSGAGLWWSMRRKGKALVEA